MTRTFGRFTLRATLAEELIPVAAVASALAIGGVVLAVIGHDPLRAYAGIWRGSFGSVDAVAETLVKATPLILIGLGVVLAFRTGVFSIGAQGQLFLGAIFATGVGLALSDLPGPLLLPLMILAGSVGGALWALVPGALRAYLGINEVVVTLLMNYIAVELVAFLVNGPWRDPNAVESWTPQVGEGGWLAIIVPSTRLHAGILLGLVLTAGVYVLLFKTAQGYRLRAVGANARSAAYGGISVHRQILVAMLASGGLAGIAGMVEVSGVHHRLLLHISPDYGYTAVAVALLGRLTPAGTLLASVLFAALLVGGESLQRTERIPVAFVLMLQGLIIVGALAGQRLARRT